MEPRLKVLLRPQDLTGQVLPVALIFRHYNHISNLVLLLFGGTLGNVLLLPTYVFFFAVYIGALLFASSTLTHDLSSLALAWSSSSMSYVWARSEKYQKLFSFQETSLPKAWALDTSKAELPSSGENLFNLL